MSKKIKPAQLAKLKAILDTYNQNPNTALVEKIELQLKSSNKVVNSLNNSLKDNDEDDLRVRSVVNTEKKRKGRCLEWKQIYNPNTNSFELICVLWEE